MVEKSGWKPGKTLRHLVFGRLDELLSGQIIELLQVSVQRRLRGLDLARLFR